MKKLFILIISILMSQIGTAQDSVDVTFYYYTDDVTSSVHIPGEFNGWTPTGASSAMTYDGSMHAWKKTNRLRVGGPGTLPASTSVVGAYQYKFYDGDWFPDPMDRLPV